MTGVEIDDVPPFELFSLDAILDLVPRESLLASVKATKSRVTGEGAWVVESRVGRKT